MAHILNLFVNVKSTPIHSQEPEFSRARANYLSSDGYAVSTSSDVSESDGIPPTQLEMLLAAGSFVNRDYRLLQQIKRSG